MYMDGSFKYILSCKSSNIGTDRAGFLRWQRMAAQGRRIIKNSGRRIIIYAGN
jgi:hypothetical protein